MSEPLEHVSLAAFQELFDSNFAMLQEQIKQIEIARENPLLLCVLLVKQGMQQTVFCYKPKFCRTGKYAAN